MLRHHIGQSRNRAAMRAVDVQRQQVVAPHARRPRHVELRDHASVELECRVGRIVGRRLVRFPGFIPALWNVRGAQAGHASDFAEQVVDHVAPVA